MPSKLRKTLILTTPLWAAMIVIALGLWAVGPAPARARAGSAAAPRAATAAAPVNTETVVSFLPSFETGVQSRYSVRARRVTQVVEPGVRTDRYDERLKIVVTTTVESPRDGGGAVVAVTFDDIELEVGDPEKRARFRSTVMHAGRQEGPIAEACKRILNQTIRLELDRAGAIVAIRDTEEFLREPDLLRFSERIVGDDALRRTLAPIFAVPGAPEEAPLGREWAVSIPHEVDGLPGLRFDSRWTLSSAEAPIATVSVAGEGRFEGAAPGLSLTLSAVAGSCAWNFERGMLEHTEINRVFAADVADPESPRSIGGEMSITISRPD